MPCWTNPVKLTHQRRPHRTPQQRAPEADKPCAGGGNFIKRVPQGAEQRPNPRIISSSLPWHVGLLTKHVVRQVAQHELPSSREPRRKMLERRGTPLTLLECSSDCLFPQSRARRYPGTNYFAH